MMDYFILLQDAWARFRCNWLRFIPLVVAVEWLEWVVISWRKAIQHDLVFSNQSSPQNLFDSAEPSRLMTFKIMVLGSLAHQTEIAIVAALYLVVFMAVAEELMQHGNVWLQLKKIVTSATVLREICKLSLIYSLFCFLCLPLVAGSYYLVFRGQTASSGGRVLIEAETILLSLFLARYSWNIPAIAFESSMSAENVIVLNHPIKRFRAVLLLLCMVLCQLWSFGVSWIAGYLYFGISKVAAPDQNIARVYLERGIIFLLQSLPLVFCMILMALACKQVLERLTAPQDTPSPG